MSSTKRDYPFSDEEEVQSKKRDETSPLCIELILNDPNTDHFLVNNLEDTALEGVVTQNTTFINVLENQDRMIVANNATHTMKVYKKDYSEYQLVSVDVSPVRLTEFDDGDRIWEGAVWKGKPYGYGVMYYCGHREYEGYFYDGMKACYGTEYYGMVEKVKYRGCFFQDQRFGKGVLYNRYGAVRFDGYWLNNRPMQACQEEDMIHSHVEEVIIKEELSSVQSFRMGWYFASLETLVIGSNCLHNCPYFLVVSVPQLQSLVIGDNSVYGRMKDCRDLTTNELKCIIDGCPQLESIRIGNNSFCDYRRLYLTDLPRLQVLEVGESSFDKSNTLEISGNPTDHVPF